MRPETNCGQIAVRSFDPYESSHFSSVKYARKCKNRLETKHFKTISGRGRRLRTLGLRFWRPPLYQLSYSPILFTDSKSKPNEAGLIWKGKGGCKYAIFAAISVTAETE